MLPLSSAGVSHTSPVSGLCFRVATPPLAFPKAPTVQTEQIRAFWLSVEPPSRPAGGPSSLAVGGKRENKSVVKRALPFEEEK